MRFFGAGDLRYVILQLISEKPSHGYEIIKSIQERLGGSYAPSPGVVYPMLTMLEEMGLQSAIPWYLDGFSTRSGIQTRFDLRGDVGRLCRSAELALFRVLQEGLTNIHRHSESPTADIRLITTEDWVILEIQDYGKGMAPDLLEQSNPGRAHGSGVGLRGMYERMLQMGGRLELVSDAEGTTVRAAIPSARCASKDTDTA